MKILTRLLLVVSSMLTLCIFASCDETEDLPGGFVLEHCTIINATGQDITFAADSIESDFIAKGDTAYYENYESPIFKCNDAENPRIIVSADSIIWLLDPFWAHWQFDCQNVQLAEFEWQHTFVIDDRWLTDAWIEAQTRKHPSCSSDSWYEE